ncbi:MAG: hypothetical protein V3S55_14795, partial [Nitrospiraceae bacterium]
HDPLRRRAVIEGAGEARQGARRRMSAVGPERTFIGDTTAGWCYGIRAVQELLGHSAVKTTMVRSHVPNRGPSGRQGPHDGP